MSVSFKMFFGTNRPIYGRTCETGIKSSSGFNSGNVTALKLMDDLFSISFYF